MDNYTEKHFIIKRDCDEPMARKKNLLPCDKDCSNCMACIETMNNGERRHCTRHKAGIEPMVVRNVRTKWFDDVILVQ